MRIALAKFAVERTINEGINKGKICCPKIRRSE